MLKKLPKPRNYFAIAAHNKKGGPHTDKKKEQNKMECRQPVTTESSDYEVCNCEEALYLKELLTDCLTVIDDGKLKTIITQALEKI